MEYAGTAVRLVNASDDDPHWVKRRLPRFRERFKRLELELGSISARLAEQARLTGSGGQATGAITGAAIAAGLAAALIVRALARCSSRTAKTPFAELERAVANGDAEGVAGLAHPIAGSAANVGAGVIANAGASLEKMKPTARSCATSIISSSTSRPWAARQ